MRKLKRGLSILLTAAMFVTLPGIDDMTVKAQQVAKVDSTESVILETNEIATEEITEVSDDDMQQDATGAIVVVKSPVVNIDNSVTFTLNGKLYANAQNVYLRGTVVNDWDTGRRMEKNAAGNYTVTVSGLEPGRYQYKFCIDNVWIKDPSNTKEESGNSYVDVPGMIISGDNPAGVGSFRFTAADTMYEDAVVTSWQALDATAQAPAVGMSFDANGVLTTTSEAQDGYFYAQVTYNENGVEGKTSKTKFYYTKQALLYQYTYKADSTHTGTSDIYVWYNSKMQNIGYKFNQVNGVYQAAVNVDTTTKNFGYIVRLAGMWGEDSSTDREFTDRTIVLNEGEQYTKVKGGEGIEVPYVCPTGKTTLKNGILFTYRDDDKFYDNTLAELDGKVQVKYWNASRSETEADEAAASHTEAMVYDAQAERFTYQASNLVAGTYHFYFLVNGVKVEDKYLNGEITYEKPELTITPTVTPEEGVTTDENPVISFDIKDKTTGNPVEVQAITANLATLGYPDMTVSFKASTKKGILYIDDSIEPGSYTVPFIVTDAWGNDNEVDVPITVKEDTDSTDNWDESRIYFLLTDRFVDGDSANDYDCDKSKIEAYHGGDFAGLTSKLDYIQSLGCNTIWISPIVDNIETIMNPTLHQQAYHGYWAKDFTAIDEHLGDTEDLDALIDAAADRGIKVMVDIVVNHAGYGTEEQDNYAGMLRTDEDEVKGDVILGELDNLPDFKTEDEDVRAKLVAWQTAWANHTTEEGNRIAYFRVDTVKHVDHDTWQELKTSLAEVNPAFKMIGEYFGASISNTGNYLADGQMDSLLDFDFKSQAKNFVNGSMTKVESSLEARNTKLTNSITMGQFLSSHDEDGFLYSIGGDVSKQRVAAALQITAKGTPVIYYGEEINLSGANAFGDQTNNRYDMQFENLDVEQQATLSYYKKLLQIRSMYSGIFSKGDRTSVTASDADAYLVFKRSYEGKSIYVGLNNGTAARQVTLDVGTDYTSWTDVYSNRVYIVADGKITVNIPAAIDGGTVILAQKTAMTGIAITKPYTTTFSVGDTFDQSGLTVAATYDNGEKAAVDAGSYTVSGYDLTKAGQQTVSVKVDDGANSFVKTFSIQVNKVPATSVKMNQSSMKLEKGKTVKLSATMMPANSTDQLSWSTSNSKVATVKQDGTVTAIAAGTATIKVTTTSGKSASCAFTVSVPATKITLSRTNISVEKKKTVIIKATVSPKDATDAAVTFESSNTKVATVDKQSGKVKAIKVGTATITATTANGVKATCKITVTVPATRVIISSRESIAVGKSKTLAVTMNSSDTTDKITWKSSNKKVASVDKNGKVKGIKTGTATITATATSGKSDTCKITVVKKAVKATSVKLNKTRQNINVTKTYQLTATMSKGATDSLTWSSSNKKVATVDKNGIVTAVKKGTAKITVKTTSGKKATCMITVKIPSTKIILNKTKTTVKKGKTVTLKASVAPSNTTDKVTWSTSNKKVATVDSKGKVKGIKKGTATITAKTSSGKKITCKVTVK